MPCVDARPVSKQKPGYTCRPLESFGPGKRLLQRRGLRRRQAAIGLAPAHTSVFGSKRQALTLKIIPSLTPSLASHAHDAVDDALLLSLRQRIARDRLPLRVLRRHLVERGRHPAIADAREAGAHGGRAGDTPSKSSG